MGNPAYEVTDDLREHYNRIREQRGWSWETLADYFEQQTTDHTSPNLAKWARAQAEAAPSKRAAKSGTEKRG